MKNLLSILFLIPFVCLAQTPPNFIPRVNATGTSAGTNTHLVNASLLGGNLTNIGPLTWRLGAGPLGTTLSLVDTNGTQRFAIQGQNIFLTDTNGNIQLRITTAGVESPTGPFIGNGAGLTNLNLANSGQLWGTNAVDGSISNLNGGRVIIGLDFQEATIPNDANSYFGIGAGLKFGEGLANSEVAANSLLFGVFDSDSNSGATGSGSLGFGQSANDATITSEGVGSTAAGNADSFNISATGDASVAIGYAVGGDITAANTASHASGDTSFGNILATGLASTARGNGGLRASAEGSWALGVNSTSTHPYSVVWNLDRENPVSSSGSGRFVFNATNEISLRTPLSKLTLNATPTLTDVNDDALFTYDSGWSIGDPDVYDRIYLAQGGASYIKDGGDNIRFNAEVSGDATLNDASGVQQLAVNADGIHGTGSGLTNILEKNVVVTTNGWGNSVIDFTLGTQIDTNLTSGLTLTGISGFVTSNLNWQVIGLYTDGSIRTVTVPAPWVVSGFTSATAVDIPANTFAKLTVEALIGRRTNATIEIFTP